jgi:hypothetical protein
LHILGILIILSLLNEGCKMENDVSSIQELPLFQPHRPDFTCRIEATIVPPIDAQADTWFLEARTLESDPELLDEERDYKKIIQLTQRASERHHWKAILNLASLYLEGRDPNHGKEDAIRLVKHAIQLGIPAAYDRMGTYYMNGIVAGNATRAYAFWQNAAEMGNPHAMTFLGEKLSATWDNPRESFWSNRPVAAKMLECAFSQGDGDAAYHLRFEYAPLTSATANQKNRALRILQEGVKLGSSRCASSLAIDFDGSFDHSKMLAPFLDKARSERYFVLSKALDSSPYRRFPNLDKVLPLPPAQLPPWNGERNTLLQAAMARTITPDTTNSTSSINGAGREALDAAFTLQATGETTVASKAPFTSYWRPTAPHESPDVRNYLTGIAPGLYTSGESFETLQYPAKASKRGAIPDIVWERMLTMTRDDVAVASWATTGQSRRLSRPEPRLSCAQTEPCSVTGIWQPWLSMAHPLRLAVNQPWRQAWITFGQSVPDPRLDWLLPVEPGDLSWHLLTGR